MAQGIVKVTVNIPEELLQFVKEVAAEEKITATDVFRRALRSEKFFVDALKHKSKILIEEQDGKLYKILRD
jgi:hypothetical protein